MKDSSPSPPNAIAVIAMNGKFPGADNIETLWENVRDGAESISRFSSEELLASGVDPKLIDTPGYVPAAAVIPGIDLFDADFFHFTAREAECTDPQHRLLLECAWETLEKAGYLGPTPQGRTGVYVGAAPSSYWIKNLAANSELISSVGEVQLLVGNSNEFAATRISYKLNLTGPSLSIGTACSTSLVAVHLACTSLLDFHCDIAIAGGISIQGFSSKGYVYHEGGIMSPDGHCRPFDAKGAGTVSGNGVAMVALRRLEDALEAGDTIHAVILGSAVNNDGFNKVGFLAPSEIGQAAVVAEALAVANVSPDSIGYVEAHGTGTPLGDPIEVAALTRAFRRGTSRKQFCGLGSIKANFGHLDAAAGVTGLIKAVLALQNCTLPPTLHFENPNPKLDLENSPFFITNARRDWVTDLPRRAGVSSFGIGGTNAHVVLQEAPPQSSGPSQWQNCLLLLSAKTQPALERLRQNLADHLERNKDLSLPDVSFTLAVGRRTFTQRFAIVCQNVDEAITKLRTQQVSSTNPSSSGDKVAFYFADPAAETHSGLLPWYQSERAFRDAVNECASILENRFGLTSADLLSPVAAPAERPGDGSPKATSKFAAWFSGKYAFAALLRSWGLEPCAIIGNGLDEYLAAVLSGVFSLADGLMLVCERTGLKPNSPSIRPKPNGIEEFLRNLTFTPPRISFISSLTGKWITGKQATDPDYWINHFYAASSGSNETPHLQDLSDALGIEIGPDRVSVLSSKRESGTKELPTRQSHSASLSSAEKGYSELLSSLGELWTAGMTVDWNSFYKFERRRRVPLPTYPFERQRYWIDPPTPVSELRPPRQPETVKPPPSTIDSWFYAPRWTQSTKSTEPRLLDAAWILVADKLGLANAVASLLRKAGARVVMIRDGETYSRPESHGFVFPLEDANAHKTMWQELVREAWPVANILLFELVKPLPPDSLETRSVSALTATLRLLALVQGLGLSGGASELAVITNNTQFVNDTEVCCPESATLWGASRVIAKEYPNLRCQTLDLDWRDLEPGSIPSVASDLLAALASPARHLALRNGTLWEQGIGPVRLTKAKRPRIREGGTYLITGGLGSMGMAFAEHLAKTAHARLALVARTDPSSPPNPLLPENGAGAAAKAGRFPLITNTKAIEEMEAAAHRESRLISLSDQPGLEPLLNRCCSALVWPFVSAGFTSAQTGICDSLEQIQSRLRVLPKFQKLFALLLRWLAEDGILEQHGNQFEIKEAPCPDVLVNELAARFPQFVPVTDLISHCAQNYAQALSGEIPAITVLYPDGTSRWLDTATAKIPHYNWDSVYLGVAADLVTRLVEKRTDPIRILEVGGGTGNLTSRLTELIASGKVEYHFTDISPTFVARAREQASKIGLRDMRFARFDISQPPEPQGFHPDTYDLVLGYNVIHATPDVVQTMKYLHSLLVAGGSLALVETVSAPRWIDLIWGLTDGWWLFTDQQRRQWSPLVSLEEWEKILAESGFSFATAYPRDAKTRQQVDAGLIIGQASTRLSFLPADSFTRARHSPERLAQTRERLSQMQSDGGDVCVIAADISDPDQVREAIETTEKRFGPIHGVIHTAGLLGQNLIPNHEPAEIRRVLAPKVDGAISLASALRNRPLDFFVLCSSLSSLEPIVGQFAYSAANAFLDSFAQFRAARFPGATVSVDWGFWQELGMIETAHISEAAKQAVLNEIRSAGWSKRGVEIFSRILQSDAPGQLLVSPRPLDKLTSPDHSEALTHPVLRRCVLDGARRAIFSGTITSGSTWLVDEHRVGGQSVLPGTAYLDLAVTAFWQLHGHAPVELLDVCFLVPMTFAERETRTVRLILDQGGSHSEFRVLSQLAADKWQEHARGEIHWIGPGTEPEKIDLEARELSLSSANHKNGQTPIRFWDRVGSFRPHWRNISDAVFGEDNGVARLELPVDLAGDLPQYALHPALLDTATGFLAFRPECDAFVPFSFRRVCVFDRLPASCASAFCFLPGEAQDAVVMAGSVFDLDGNEIVRVEHYKLRRATSLLATTDLGAAGITNATNAPENVQLEIESPGQLQTLIYRPGPRFQPRTGEVEIEVRAAGLNFVEVLHALGMLPDFSIGRVALGQECAGLVVNVGDGVDAFKPGDEVFGYGPACCSLYTRLNANGVALKPPALSFEAAAGLPAGYATAWYSLIQLARLRPAERILIHAAAGGVGLAAVRIAQWRRAEIFATAGSPEKRQFLRDLGVQHVMDSRSLLFAEEIRQITNGDGVDVILNSLGGDFIAKSLALLRRHGRFLELGKRDIFRNLPLGLGAFANYVAFIAVDTSPDIPGFAEMWHELTAHLQSGTLAPLPYTTFAATQVQDAYEYMAQARHIGKVVLSFTDPQAVRSAATAQPAGRRNDPLFAGSDDFNPRQQQHRPEPWSTTATTVPAKHQRPHLPTEFRASESSSEKAIALVWEELLGVAPIGIDDDFFELNGDSLLAAQVMSRIHQHFEVKTPVSLIFDFPTIRGLASQIADRLQPARPLTENSEEITYEDGAI